MRNYNYFAFASIAQCTCIFMYTKAIFLYIRSYLKRILMMIINNDLNCLLLKTNFPKS